jgi:hypothetical protein
VTDSLADWALEKGIIHSIRCWYWLGLSLLSVRDSILLQIKNQLSREERTPGLGQLDVTMKIQPLHL